MGFFSWKTMDTDTSISNSYSNRGTFKVEMLDDKGNVWTETDYDGYGVFGGKDFYELLAEMNGVVERDTVQLQGEAYTEYMRREGINIAFKNNGSGDHTNNVKYPNLVEMADGWQYNPIGPERCPDQGYFYSNEEDDDWENNPEEKYWENTTTWNERHSNTDEDLW